MLDINAKLTKLLESEPDPREGAGGRREFNQTKLLMRCPPTVGVVTDNRDPDCLGRIRISYDTVVPGSVSPWLPVIGQGRGTGKGMWTLPEIGTQCLAVFTTADRSRGYVLGFIYDREHLPPESGTEKRCDSTLLQTRSHRQRGKRGDKDRKRGRPYAGEHREVRRDKGRERAWRNKHKVQESQM